MREFTPRERLPFKNVLRGEAAQQYLGLDTETRAIAECKKRLWEQFRDESNDSKGDGEVEDA